MIRSIRLQNFKAIRGVEVSLERLTVFVGPNGSGKTSILQGLDFLVNAPERYVSYRDDYSNSVSDYYRHNDQRDMKLFGSTQAECVQLRVRPSLPITAGLDKNTANNLEWSTRFARRTNNPSAVWSRFDPAHDVETSLGQAQLFRFDAGLMTQPSAHQSYRVTSDGRWLASTLSLMASDQPDQFARLQEMLTRFIPAIVGVRLEKALARHFISGADLKPFERTNQRVDAETIVLDLKDGRSIPARSASEGTLVILGLATVLVNRHRPNLILIDDLDRGLHPLAQRDVIRLLRDVMAQKPDLQIVATTHSPYLVDDLRPEEVRMMTLRDDGTVACGPLVEHPDYPKWKNEFNPGEFWSMFGEKWVADLASEGVL